jgi:hypothetical protein
MIEIVVMVIKTYNLSGNENQAKVIYCNAFHALFWALPMFAKRCTRLIS